MGLQAYIRHPVEKGIDGDRVIVENQSITTAQNAIFSCQILQEKYPQVNQLAIISSDYHIATAFDIYYDTYDIHELPPIVNDSDIWISFSSLLYKCIP